MIKPQLFKAFLLLFLCTLSFTLHAEESTPSFAVVELFTSEGCSSCPNADLILSKLLTSVREKKLPVYPLSMHVDYWNNLGWRDPFSNAFYSQRQRNYAHLLKTEVYTPQIVVNGFEVMEGYDSQKLVKAINTQLSQNEILHLKAHLSKRTEDHVTVHYETQGTLEAGDEVYVLLVERNLQMEVTAGENIGRVLRHDNVVRLMQRMETPQGKITLPLENINDLANGAVVIFVQNSLTLLIKTALQLDLQDV